MRGQRTVRVFYARYVTNVSLVRSTLNAHTIKKSNNIYTPGSPLKVCD